MAIYEYLSDNAQNFSEDRLWMLNKPPEVIWYLRKFEVYEFNNTLLTEMHFLNPDEDPPFFKAENYMVPLSFLCGPQPMYTDAEMPTTLRARIYTAADLQAPPSNNTGGGGGGGNGGGGKDKGNDKGNNKDKKRRINPNYSPIFRDFFQGLPEDKKRERLSSWFKAQNTTTNKQLRLMGVDDSKCGTCIYKEICRFPGCKKDHSGFPKIPDDKAQACVEVMKKGAGL